jgi:hypothetical protein
MKTVLLSFVGLLMTVLSVNTASAQNPHLMSPISTSVTADGKLEVCFDIAGLGNMTQVDVVVKYTATVNTLCYNPGSSEGPVPGQSKTYPNVSETFEVEVSNGRTGYKCVTSTQKFAAGKCPNPKWTPETTVMFSDVTVTVPTANGRKTVTFTAPNPQ